ncbi:putative Ig domain-containing protein [Comamonas sp. JC664]|uniref:putative Ig domain-containing protein n=1 Tax=Comamonas sp. JC664 TaxID=2801917 RepID=UPI00361F4E99
MTAAPGASQWSVPANVAGLAPVMVEVTDGKGGIATRATPSRSRRLQPRTRIQLHTGDFGHRRFGLRLHGAGDRSGWRCHQLYAGPAPAGMAIHATSGAISWTPTLAQGGTHAVAVRATDAKGPMPRKALAFTCSCQPTTHPQISSKPALRWAPGVPYQYQVTATDPENDPLTYALDKAPAGMAISASGLLTWNARCWQPCGRDQGAGQPRAPMCAKLYLADCGQPRAVITSAPVPTAAIAAPYAYQVVATDPDGDFLTYRMSGAPASLTMSATGLISGTPTSQGTHAITVTVSDRPGLRHPELDLARDRARSGRTAGGGRDAIAQIPEPGESTTLQVFAQGGTAPYTVSSRP